MQTWSAVLSTSRPFGAAIGSGHSLSKSANWWEVNRKPGRDCSLASRVEVTVVLIQGQAPPVFVVISGRLQSQRAIGASLHR
jgi:hypothetical protein